MISWSGNNDTPHRPKIGVHISIAGGLGMAAERAIETGCDCIALFSGSPRIWKRTMPSETDIRIFTDTLQQASIHPVIVHAPYLVNIASPDRSLFERSIDLLSYELGFAERIGSNLVVSHPGSHGGEGRQFGYERCVAALEEVFSRHGDGSVGIALELTAGGGHQICSTFDDAETIIRMAGMDDRLSICVDTCHLFVAGYDIRSPDSWRSTISDFQSRLDLSVIRVVHLNDSMGALGSHIDRHTHIGEGEIGMEGFRAIVNDRRLAGIPMILETPKGLDNSKDRANLRMLRSLTVKTS